jgi:two-component system, NarL family, sensor histidine kinase EvgS
MKNILKSIIILFTLMTNFAFANSQVAVESEKKDILRLEWKHQFEFAGFYAALEKGYYKEFGIDLEIKEFEEGINISEEVLSGKATFGISSSALILERLNKKPVVLIGSYFKQNALSLVTKPEIKTPYDLKNKKIMAVDWEMQHTSLGVMLKDYGISENDYTFVNHDFKVDKFISGEVDAMSIFITSQPYELDKLGVKYNILNPANFGIYSYDVELFTSEMVINKDLEKVKNFVSATNKGWAYAFNNKEEIVDLIYDKYTKRKSKEALLFEANKTEEIFKTNVFKIGAIVPELIKLNADMYSNLNLVDKNDNISAILKDYYITDEQLPKINFTEEEKAFLRKNPILKVHNEGNWPPYNYTINNEAEGYSIDYMNLLASKIGLKVQYISGFTWNEYIEKLEKNEIDIMLNISKTPSREKLFEFTSPYTKNIDAIFVKKDITNIKSLDDLKGKTLAVIDGFYEEDVLKKHYPEINLLLVEDSIEGLKKVAFGQADGTFDNFVVGNYFIEKNFITNIKPAFEIKDSNFNLDMSIAVNKNNLVLRNILEKVKKELTQEELDLINKKIFNTNKTYKNAIALSKEEQSYIDKKELITMCVDPDWLPFEKLDEKNKHIGISADLIKLLSTRLGIQIDIVPSKNWEESLSFSKNKKCDILSFLNKTPQREKWLDFTDILFTDENVIIGRAEMPLIKDLSKIQASIAIPKGTAMYEKIENDFPNLIIIPVDSENEAFNFIEQKKVDLTIRSLIVSAYTIKENSFFNLKILYNPKNYENNLRIGIQKNEPILKAILNKGINTITQEDRNEIVNKWVTIKYENKSDYTYLWISLALMLIISIFFLYRQYILKHNNDYLKKEVAKRTAQLESSNLILKEKKDELHELNQNLEIKIKEEVEKNKLIQERLFRSDKLASMGEMIGNIAHQWRQPLSIISTIATGIKIQKEMNLLTDEELLENMEIVNKNAQYLSKTIDDFKNFIRADKTIEDYNLSKTIGDFIHIIEPSLKSHNIDLILNLDENIFINGCANELAQCLINFFNNSKDALVETKQEKSLFFVETKIEDNIIYIIVKDNAGGIPSEIISKIFEPYFTTKHKAQGTGLGLSMTYKLITDGLNGKIEVSNKEFIYDNKTYVGAEFIISIEI